MKITIIIRIIPMKITIIMIITPIKITIIKLKKIIQKIFSLKMLQQQNN